MMMDTAQPILVWRAQPQSHQPGRSRCISNTIPNLRLLHMICNFRKGHGMTWHLTTLPCKTPPGAGRVQGPLRSQRFEILWSTQDIDWFYLGCFKRFSLIWYEISLSLYIYICICICNYMYTGICVWGLLRRIVAIFWYLNPTDQSKKKESLGSHLSQNSSEFHFWSWCLWHAPVICKLLHPSLPIPSYKSRS